MRLVFVDGRFTEPAIARKTKDLTLASGIRQTLAAPVHPEVFQPDGKPGAMCHVYTGKSAKSASDQPLLLLHITQGVDSDELNTALSPPSGAGGSAEATVTALCQPLQRQNILPARV